MTSTARQKANSEDRIYFQKVCNDLNKLLNTDKTFVLTNYLK